MRDNYRKSIKRIVFGGFCVFSMLIIASCGMVVRIPLDKPENLKVTDITHDQAIVTWDSVPNTNTYEVEVFKADGSDVKTLYFPSDSRVEIKSLEWDETYVVSVTPRASGTIWDKYTYGETASVRFKTNVPGVPEGQFSRPQNVKAVYDCNTKKINVSWDKVENAAFYEIKCEYSMITATGVERVNEDRIQLVEAPDISFIDNYINEKKLKDVRKVYYTVWARDAKLESEKNESKKIFVRIF